MSVRRKLSSLLYAKIDFQLGIIPTAALAAAAAAIFGWYVGFTFWPAAANAFIWMGYGAMLASPATGGDSKSSCNEALRSPSAIVILVLLLSVVGALGAFWLSFLLAMMLLGSCAGVLLAVQGHSILATEIVRQVARAIRSLVSAHHA